MKINKYIILGLLISFNFIACEDNLEIEPLTEKVSTNFFSNEAEIESAVAGVYGQLQNGGLYGLDLIGVGEITDDNYFIDRQKK